MYEVQFVEESLSEIWSDMVYLGRPYQSRPYHLKFLEAVLHKFYLVYFWIPWSIYYPLVKSNWYAGCDWTELIIFNLFLVNFLILYLPPENTRKPKVF